MEVVKAVGPGVSWLTPCLAISGCVREESVEYVARSLRLRLVIDLRQEIRVEPSCWTNCGVEFLPLPTPDHSPVSPDMLSLGVTKTNAALALDHRVLIHCQFGIGRSALLACCVLVAQGYDPAAAIRLAKQARPIVSPHPDQLHALLNFAQTWREKLGKLAYSVTWDDLAAIAYANVRSADRSACVP
jgi:protein-tyrosine phosphatase